MFKFFRSNKDDEIDIEKEKNCIRIIKQSVSEKCGISDFIDYDDFTVAFAGSKDNMQLMLEICTQKYDGKKYLYAEEIKKSLGKNIPSDLIGHTMYKAPTMSTASSYTTSMYAPPKRQSQVLYNYYMPKSNKMSSGYALKKIVLIIKNFVL